MMNILKIISACDLDLIDIVIKCHIFLYTISYDIIQPLNKKKTCSTEKSLGHLYEGPSIIS